MKQISIILLFLATTYLYSQVRERDTLFLPTPVVGWDSLSRLISYPEIARRAGVQAGYLVKLRIDTLGNIHRINIFELSHYENQVDTSLLLSHSLYHALNKTRWISGTRAGKKEDCTITIPVFFTVKLEGQSDPIIKNIPAAIIHKDY